MGELRKRLNVLPKKGRETPKYKGLLQSEKKVLISSSVAGATVTVYENGYVLYRSEIGSTVFPFPDSGDYLYESSRAGSQEVVDGESFESAAWYVRLVIEGEDHLNDNSERRYYAHTVSYSAVSEEWKELLDRVGSVEDVLSAREQEAKVARIMERLTVKQRDVVIGKFWSDKSFSQVADDLGIDRKNAWRSMESALRKMKKHLDSEADDTDGGMTDGTGNETVRG